MQCHLNTSNILCPGCQKTLNHSACLLPCGHRYHTECIASILKLNEATALPPLPSLHHSIMVKSPENSPEIARLSQSTPFFASKEPLKKIPDPLPWTQLPDLTHYKLKNNLSLFPSFTSRLPFNLICQLNDLTRNEYPLCCAVCDVPSTVVREIEKDSGYEIRSLLYYLEKEHQLKKFISCLEILNQQECLKAIACSSAAHLFEHFPAAPTPQSITKKRTDELQSLFDSLENILEGFEERLLYQCGIQEDFKNEPIKISSLLKKLFKLKKEEGLALFLERIKNAFYLSEETKIKALKIIEQSPCSFLFSTIWKPDEVNDPQAYLLQVLIFTLEACLQTETKEHLSRFLKDCECNKIEVSKYLAQGTYLFFIETYKKKKFKGLHLAYTKLMKAKYFSDKKKKEFDSCISSSPCRHFFID